MHSPGGDHQRLAYTGGHELAVILDAAITGGQVTVIDTHARHGDASPVHVHNRDDEAFLLLDGQMTVWVGEARHQLRPGGIAFLPRNIPHAVRYDIASRALVLSTPAGFQEEVFRSAGWDLAGQARRLAAHPGLARQGRAAGRGQADRATPRARRLTTPVTAEGWASAGSAQCRPPSFSQQESCTPPPVRPRWASAHLRIARPGRDLTRTTKFWVSGLGRQVLERVQPQASGEHELVMLGWPGAAWHLELVRRP